MILSKWLKKNPDARDLFDWKWYAARNRLEGEDTAWEHYSTESAKLCLNPNPFFNRKWYLSRHPEALGVGALQHFLSADVARALCPSPLFESEHYLDRNPDVRRAGINPLVHYLKWGRREGRLPNRWCDRAYAGDPVFDIELPADFLPDDIIGYIPHYSTLARLVSGAEASTFLDPSAPYWIFAKLAKGDEEACRTKEVAFIGGRREFLSGLSVFAPDSGRGAPARYRAFQVRYAVSPIIRNAISALGRDLGTIDAIERLRREVENVILANPSVSVSDFSLVIDADLKTKVHQNFSRSSLSAVNIVALEEGCLCRAVRPMIPASEPARSSGR